MKSNLKPIAAALGTTFAVSLAVSLAANAADNPFGMTELSKGGYMIAASHGEGGASAYYNQGNAKFRLGDHYGAIADYDRVSELDSRLAFRAEHARKDLAKAERWKNRKDEPLLDSTTKAVIKDTLEDVLEAVINDR